MSDFDDKIAAAAARVVMAPEAKKRGKCWELFHTVIWGQDGAKHLDVKIALIVGFEIVFLALVLLDAFVGGHLHKHGIHPRDFPMGLVGVFFAPFLHKGLTHFLLNMVPFGVLGLLVMLRKKGIATFLTLSAGSAVVSGVLVWCLGAHKSNHIGSSGLIFAYFAFLLVGGAIRRNLRDFLISIAVFLAFSSMAWSLLPTDEHVSWEMHLFGLLAGVAYAFIDNGLKDADGDADEAADADAAAEEEREGLLA